MQIEKTKDLASKLFAARSNSQGPVYLHPDSATGLLLEAQDVVAEIGTGSSKSELVAPSAWHALIFLWWMAKRAATKDTVEKPLDEVFVGSRLIFRGQKASYNLGASIRRREKPEWLIHQNATRLLHAAINRLLKQSPDALVREFWPSVTLTEAACIAQHYKSSEGPLTFLLDWSLDPFIGVHFATLHARNNDSDEAAVYILSFRQAIEHRIALIAPPLFAGRLYDQAGMFLDTEGASQELNPSEVLRVLFPVDRCVELPQVAGIPYDPLERDPFWGPVIDRTMAITSQLSRHDQEALAGSADRIAELSQQISANMQLVAPWYAAVQAVMPSSSRANEVKFIQNMIVRYVDWLAFRANLVGPGIHVYYDPKPLAILAQSSPSIIESLFKSEAVLKSLNMNSDQRVALITQALGSEVNRANAIAT